ncbi:MAG: hypothetical protein Q8K89_09245, partial [Actinomycetota bacterium]|nr:hypothetical protein [Actinomycetota bacterium]
MRFRRVSKFLALVVTAAMVIGPVAVAPASAASVGVVSKAAKARIDNTRKVQAKRITQDEREVAAARLRLLGGGTMT